MAGNRKAQRSVRVTLSAVLMGLAAVAVVASVASGRGVAAAAIFSLLCGLAAVRIVCTEVTQTRRGAARTAAAQAKGFAETIGWTRSEHAQYVVLMTTRVSERDRTIGELNGAIRLAEKRADVAEQRVKHEARRANEAQERLANLLDDLLVAASLETEDEPGLTELPAILNLLAWEDRANESMLSELRREG